MVAGLHGPKCAPVSACFQVCVCVCVHTEDLHKDLSVCTD